MVFELKNNICHPPVIQQIDIITHDLPYPIKRIHVGA